MVNGLSVCAMAIFVVESVVHFIALVVAHIATIINKCIVVLLCNLVTLELYLLRNYKSQS